MGASPEARIADREMLLALKIHSMRMADRRDVIALCGGKVDTTKVAKHLARSPKNTIGEHIGRFCHSSDDPKSRNSLKQVFVFSNSVLEGLLAKSVITLKEIDKRL